MSENNTLVSSQLLAHAALKSTNLQPDKITLRQNVSGKLAEYSIRSAVIENYRLTKASVGEHPCHINLLGTDMEVSSVLFSMYKSLLLLGIGYDKDLSQRVQAMVLSFDYTNPEANTAFRDGDTWIEKEIRLALLSVINESPIDAVITYWRNISECEGYLNARKAGEQYIRDNNIDRMDKLDSTLQKAYKDTPSELLKSLSSDKLPQQLIGMINLCLMKYEGVLKK